MENLTKNISFKVALNKASMLFKNLVVLALTQK